jgi:predicted O-methyltransferase YrrM
MSGYVGDVAHTLGFYRELAPPHLNYACHISGVEGLPAGRRLRYAELGCGRGYGTSLLAAANPDIDFVGIDFNPSHIAEARALAKRADLPNVTFLESSFADAAQASGPSVPQYDVMAMHGVYSWIQPQVREDLHQLFRSALAPGGLLYVSYNALPGWAPMVPVQRLLMEVASRSTGDSIAQIKRGLTVLKALTEKPNAFIGQNPALKARIAAMEKQDIRYLAHEFLNSGWRPLFVTEAMEMLAGAKLTYVGSASLPENHPDVAVPKEMRELVEQASDRAMRELLMDYAANKQFRRDIYIKGPQKLSPTEHRKRIAETRFALLHMDKDIPEKLRVPIGELAPKKEIARAVIDRLRLGPAAGTDLAAVATKAGATEANVWTLLQLQVNAGLIAPASAGHALADRAPARRMNNAVLELALGGDTHRYLATPVIGGAVSTNQLERLAAYTLAQDPKADDRKVAGSIFEHMKANGQGIMRDGKPVQKNAESLAEVTNYVKDFRNQRLPRWRALKLVD